MKIILPRTLHHVDSAYGPLFFLAGPILGADDWHSDCCRKMMLQLATFYAAIPQRYDPDHSLHQYVVEAQGNSPFPRQLNWERHYLWLASQLGCIIFWLPCESKLLPRDDGNPYAMDTRGELGEWRAKLAINPNCKVVVGAEADFPGLSQIQRNFSLELGRDFPIYQSLDETVEAASVLATNK